MKTIWHLLSKRIDGLLAQHLYVWVMGLLKVMSRGTMKYSEVELRMAFSHTIPKVKMFYFIVDKCSDFKLIPHWFGGDGMYVNPKAPTQIVFSVTMLLTVVSSYKLELKFKVVKVVSADGLITLKVFMEMVDFVYERRFLTTIRFWTSSMLQ